MTSTPKGVNFTSGDIFFLILSLGDVLWQQMERVSIDPHALCPEKNCRWRSLLKDSIVLAVESQPIESDGTPEDETRCGSELVKRPVESWISTGET